MIIRKAEVKDINKMLDIYNYEVVNGIATFDMEAKDYQDRLEWFNNHNIKNHPLLVAEIDGEVVGYGSLSEYRSKDAYDCTVELSLYVDPTKRGSHIGQKLLEVLIDYAKNDESIHTIISVITDLNYPSIKLHEKFGFENCGHLKEIGCKNGQYLGVINYCLQV